MIVTILEFIEIVCKLALYVLCFTAAGEWYRLNFKERKWLLKAIGILLVVLTIELGVLARIVGVYDESGASWVRLMADGNYKH